MKPLIATCEAYPHGNTNLQQLARAINAMLTPWQHIDPTAQHGRRIYPLAVWDYSQHPDRYLQWLAALEQHHATLINSAALQRWNLNKQYLIELAQHDCPITPSLILTDQDDWQTRITNSGWENPVIKPLIGQSGHGVRRLHDAPLTPADYPHHAILQPYIEAPQGEICLIYLHGTFSHAVLRYGKDWRKNSQYGAKTTAITAEKHWRDAAETVFPHLPEPPMYARIDGLLDTHGHFLINEVELIEPALYLPVTQLQSFR